MACLLEKYNEKELIQMGGTSWLFITGLYLNITEKISTKTLLCIKSSYEYSIKKIQLDGNRIEQQASFILQSIEVLSKLTKLSSNDINPTSKRIRRNSNDLICDNDSNLILISQICSILERFSIDLLFSSSCNHFILELLDSELIISEFKICSFHSPSSRFYFKI